MAFKKATKSQAKLRMAISGPSGSGKTWTALTVAKHMGQRVAVIDTERGSASKYAGEAADFDVQELDDFSVQNYMAAIREAAQAGYDVLVIDSLTHAWAGRGGILEEVDKRGGKFEAWRHASPLHARFVDQILSYPGHVIATMRSKMDYLVSQVERNGRKETKIEKVGLAPVQRDDMSYEFDVWLDMNDRHIGTVFKTRCHAIADMAIDKPGKDLADALKTWLSDGAPAPAAPERRPLAAAPRDASTVEKRQDSGQSGQARKANEVDEYGLTVPASKCPVVGPGKANAGTLWSELPGGLLEQMYADFGDKMNAQQLEWAEYLLARRSARKAKEAREQEAAAAGAEPAGDTAPQAQESV